MSFRLDNVIFEVYAPQRLHYDEDNNYSLAISVIHGNNKFLFAGHAKEIRLAEILTQTNSQYDFLKVPHHGKYNSFSEQFIKTINPKYSVITCSKKNPPHDEVLNILGKVSSEIYLTRDGNIKVTSNKNTFTINQ